MRGRLSTSERFWIFGACLFGGAAWYAAELHKGHIAAVMAAGVAAMLYISNRVGDAERHRQVAEFARQMMGGIDANMNDILELRLELVDKGVLEPAISVGTRQIGSTVIPVPEDVAVPAPDDKELEKWTLEQQAAIARAQAKPKAPPSLSMLLAGEYEMSPENVQWWWDSISGKLREEYLASLQKKIGPEGLLALKGHEAPFAVVCMVAITKTGKILAQRASWQVSTKVLKVLGWTPEEIGVPTGGPAVTPG